MADGGEDKENEAKKDMQIATAKLFEKRTKAAEIVQTDSARIPMPLSRKWQTIIDDTIIPRMYKQYEHPAVRKRSKSIAPEDEDGERRPRPLSMPNVASPIPFDMYDDDGQNVQPTEIVEVERDETESPRRTRPPVKLLPLGAPPPPPPSYEEAIHMEEKSQLPRTLPFYGRLWQMSRRWHKEIPSNRDIEETPPTDPSLESNGTRSFPSNAPRSSIDKGARGSGFVMETSFTNIDTAPSRLSHYSENVDTTRRDVLDIEEGRTEAKKSPECDNWFGNRFPRVVRYLQSLTHEKMLILGAVIIVIIGVIIFLGVFPASFVYVEYHEMALLKNKVTGTVYRDDVYFTGCYVLGPDKEFVRYPNYANIISEKTEVFTMDRLIIDLTFHLQYYIRSNELGDLHREYEKDYNSVIRNVIISEIKNNVGTFNLDYFRLSRPYLEKHIFNLLQKRLEGNCCKTCCPSNCVNNTACVTCQPAPCHPGYHVDIKYFQLTQIDIPAQVSDLYVQKLVLQVDAEKEYLLQNHAVVTKETSRLTKYIQNEAKELKEDAEAVAAKTKAFAEADREANITLAYVRGLQYMYLTLGVNDEDHKLSLMMMRALENLNVKGNLYRGYGYNISTIASSP